MAGPVRGTFLLRSASALGTALVSGDYNAYPELGTAKTQDWGQKLITFVCSGNPASADILVPLYGDPAFPTWISATSTGMPAGTTGSAILSAYYPYMMAQLSFVSGGARTATVNIWVGGGPAGL